MTRMLWLTTRRASWTGARRRQRSSEPDSDGRRVTWLNRGLQRAVRGCRGVTVCPPGTESSPSLPLVPEPLSTSTAAQQALTPAYPTAPSDLSPRLQIRKQSIPSKHKMCTILHKNRKICRFHLLSYKLNNVITNALIVKKKLKKNKRNTY